MPTLPIRNAFSIDVEDYFQVSALAPHFPRHIWDQQPCRVERNVDRMLALLSDNRTQATFFTLGWVAERYPEMTKRIVAEGHELASHGYGHQRVSDLDRAGFFEDITRAKKLLEDLGGQAVIGYRAPSFSIGEKNLWALDTLGEAGFIPFAMTTMACPMRRVLRFVPTLQNHLLSCLQQRSGFSIVICRRPAEGTFDFSHIKFRAGRFVV